MGKLHKHRKTNNIYSCIIDSKRLQKVKHEFTENEIRDIYENLTEDKEPISDIYIQINKFMNCKLRYELYNLKSKNCFNKDFLIKELGNKDNANTIKELAEKHRSLYPKFEFSNNNLRRFVKENMKYRYKCISLSNSKSQEKDSDKMHLLFAKKLIEIMKENHKLLYMDESSFSEERLNKRRWVCKNMQHNFTNETRFGSFSVIGIFSEYGLFHFKIFEKTIKGEDVLNFLKESQDLMFLNKTFTDFLKNDKITIILDNAKNHVKKTNIKAYKEMKLRFLFQPPYSPSNNVSEYAWSIIKKIKRRKTFRSK